MSRLQITRSRYRVRATEDLVEEWQALHKEAMRVRDYETVLAECSDLARLLVEVLTSVADDFLMGEDDCCSYDDRSFFADSADRCILAFQRMIGDGASFQKDYTIDGYTNFTERLDKLRQASRRLRETCLEADEKMIEQTGEDIKRGETFTVDEAFSDAIAPSEG